MTDDYEMLCDFQRLYAAHKAARRGKRGKAEVIDFEMNLSENLCALQKALTDRTYTQKGYQHFTIYEPKKGQSSLRDMPTELCSIACVIIF